MKRSTDGNPTHPHDIVGNEWRSFIEPLLPIGENMSGLLSSVGDKALRHDLYHQLFSLISSGYWQLLYQDPDNPDFVPYWFNWGAPNPDDIYTATPIRSDGCYRISGSRGSVHMVSFTIGSGMLFTHGIGTSLGANIAEYDLDSIQHNPSGEFEVVLSRSRPADYVGHWWPLDPSATYILVRQRFYDWRNESIGRLAIQRIDQPIMRNRRNSAEIARGLLQIAEWTESWAKWSAQYFRRSRELGFINRLEATDLSSNGGLNTSRYLMGAWEIDADEALIFESDIPDRSRYWAVQLADELFQTLDHLNLNRQSSLNGHSGMLDRDGKFRAIICQHDPGVPNWLDTTGRDHGGILSRWIDCSSYPMPTLKRVKCKELRSHLPPETPAITPTERDRLLRLRRESYQWRHRWN